MIIYGIRSNSLHESVVEDQSCPNCGHEDSIRMYCHARYFHVFWVPMFSIGRKGRVVCINCDTEWKISKTPIHVQDEYAMHTEDSKIPWWHFIGLAVLALFISWAIVINKQTKSRRMNKVETPVNGDLYITKEPFGYGVERVIGVSNDSVYVVESVALWEKRYRALKNSENTLFDTVPVVYSRAEIKTRLIGREIIDVRKKEKAD